MYRLGKKEEGKTRPILVQCKEEETKKELFVNLWKLKNASDRIANLSIGHDMSKEEREETRRLVTEAKSRAKKNPGYRFKLRGPPWKRVISKIKTTQATEPWSFSNKDATITGEQAEVENENVQQ